MGVNMDMDMSMDGYGYDARAILACVRTYLMYSSTVNAQHINLILLKKHHC
jgi:hypothetical protein